jgi:hypothetical protein
VWRDERRDRHCGNAGGRGHSRAGPRCANQA